MRLVPIAAAMALCLPVSVEARRPAEADMLICKRAAARLGSRVKKPKVCRPASQWRAIEAAEPSGVPLTIKAPQLEPGQPTRPQ